MIKVEQNLIIETYSSEFSSSSSPQAVRLSAGLGGACAFICGLLGVFLIRWSISAEPTGEDLLLKLLEQLQTNHRETISPKGFRDIPSPAGFSPGQVQSFHAAVRMQTDVSGQAGGVGVGG